MIEWFKGLFKPKKYAWGGHIGTPFDYGPPIKLTGGEGYFRWGGKTYYWKEVGEW